VLQAAEVRLGPDQRRRGESGIDRRGMLAWSIQMLMAAAGQAIKQKNPGEVVSSVRPLDWITGLGVNSTAGHRFQRSRF